MTKLKCPFCNKPLQPTLRLSDEYWCENYDCPRTNIEWVGSKKLWQELINTKKALDRAMNAMESASNHNVINCVVRGVDPKEDDVNITLFKALAEINEITKGGKDAE